MFAKPFNKSKPYGECFGSPSFAFWQNGQYYNAAFTPVDKSGAAMEIDPKYLKAAPVAEAKPAPAPIVDDDDDTPEDERPIDLKAWARGELPTVMWHVAQAAIASQTGETPPNKKAAIAIIEKHMGPIALPDDAE